MSIHVQQVRESLEQKQNKDRAENPLFFKIGPGEYAEHDKFIGVSVPTVRKIANNFYFLTLQELSHLLCSPYNEERLLGLFVVVKQYQKADNEQKDLLYQFYLDNIAYVNNWNLVDSSAHYIMGHHMYIQGENAKTLLIEYAGLPCVWKRRIAIVATWYFIRCGEYGWTLRIAEQLIHDTHDLIHKAVGWMLREVGKKDELVLCKFLDQYAACMPRTMLRYALEKLSADKRQKYMKK